MTKLRSYVLATTLALAVPLSGQVQVQPTPNVSSVTGTLPVANGGTGATTAAGAATNLGLGTGDSPQFTAVNLGAATDTTLSRVSAGLVAVEGNTVAMLGTANVFTASQTTHTGVYWQLTSANVAQPFTGIMPTNRYGMLMDRGSTVGGVALIGASDTSSTNGVNIQAYIGTSGATSAPAMYFYGAKSNGGTGAAVLGNAEVVLRISNYTSDLIDVLGDGSTTFVGAIRSNSGFNINGTAGCTGTPTVSTNGINTTCVEPQPGHTIPDLLARIEQLEALVLQLEQRLR